MAHFFVASDALRLVAVYSPKCGSQSIRAWCTAAIEVATNEPVENLDHYLIWHRKVRRYGDYWKVFFIRDPLRRLVGFYGLWVVRNETMWCFADAQRKLSLRNRSFRQFIFALQHAYRHGFEFQHHLVPQIRDTEDIAFDQNIAVERLSEGLEALNCRLGVSTPIPHKNRRPYDNTQREPAADRLPEWFREHGVPLPELFYDDDTRAIAMDLYAEDVAYYRKTTGLEVCGGCLGRGL